jgi:hypothetical protein
MASRTITVKIDIMAETYDYVDESGHHGPDKHIHKGDPDTISWKSDAGDIAIHFLDGSLFTQDYRVLR